MRIGILPSSPLFCGMTQAETEDLLGTLASSTKVYKNGESVFHIGEHITTAGLVLLGGINIVKNDVWGNRKIIEHIGTGQLFGETYACIPTEPLMVNAEASGDTKILFLTINRVFSQEITHHAFATKLIQNLVFVLARRNLTLTRKMDYITPKTIRERLLTYFSYQYHKQGSRTFKIAFNRQQLADYLSVDRSALSNELSKMQRDGLISIDKHTFRLLTLPADI